MKKMDVDELKNFVRSAGKTELVKELVENGWKLEAALEWVHDMLTLTKKEFIEKHFN